MQEVDRLKERLRSRQAHLQAEVKSAKSAAQEAAAAEAAIRTQLEAEKENAASLSSFVAALEKKTLAMTVVLERCGFDGVSCTPLDPRGKDLDTVQAEGLEAMERDVAAARDAVAQTQALQRKQRSFGDAVVPGGGGGVGACGGGEVDGWANMLRQVQALAAVVGGL